MALRDDLNGCEEKSELLQTDDMGGFPQQRKDRQVLLPSAPMSTACSSVPGANAKEAEDNFNEARGLFALNEGGR
jgi:hypothetical protein